MLHLSGNDFVLCVCFLPSPKCVLGFTNYFLTHRRNTKMEKILERWNADMISTQIV